MKSEAFEHEAYACFISCARNFFRINPYTSEIYVIKYKGDLWETPNQPVSGEGFLEDLLSEKGVWIEDRWQFDIFKDPIELVRQYKTVRDGITMIYRRMEGMKKIWHKVEFLIPEDHSEEKPYLYLFGRDLDKQMSLIYDSITSYTLRLHKIAKVNAANQTVFVIQEPYAEHRKTRKVWIRDFQEEAAYICENFIYPDDAEDFYEKINTENFAREFSNGNDSVSYYFRRRLGTMYHWIRIRVIPAENQSYYLYAEDIHSDYLKLVDYRNIQLFSKFYGGHMTKNIEAYYENMLMVLHGLTQSYVDFYMVLLDKDLYIQYKFQSDTLHRVIPVVGSYSQISADYIREFVTGQQAEMLRLYSTSEKLRELMRDRMTLEYEFYNAEGQKLRTIVQKIESLHGTPTKVLCRTVSCQDEEKLIIRTFGNFEVIGMDDKPVHFTRKQSKQLLAYLIDRQGYPVTSKDIVADVLEKPENDLNAIKYCSTLIRSAMSDLEKAGFPNVIIKEQKTVRINPAAVDCDYYHLLKGERSYLLLYHNEYMKEYSWGESTNAEIQSMLEK